jgi:hypothetical protein
MTPQAPDFDPNWLLSRGNLADEALRSLQNEGFVIPARGSAVDQLELWLGDFRDKICKRWLEGRTAGVSKLELAAMIADTLSSLNNKLPAAVLSIYLVRYSADRLCKDYIPKP